MQNIIVRVYYNSSVSAMITGYVQGDLLEQVWQGFVRVEQRNPLAVCSQVFELFNHYGPSTAGWSRRSMSVGDVVELVFEDASMYLYACVTNSWDWINQPEPVNPHVELRPVYLGAHIAPLREHFTEVEWNTLVSHFRDSGNKIYFIKEVREIGKAKGYYYGLLETKNFVDDWIYNDENPCSRCGKGVCICGSVSLTHLYDKSNASETLCGSLRTGERVHGDWQETTCPECNRLRDSEIPF